MITLVYRVWPLESQCRSQGLKPDARTQWSERRSGRAGAFCRVLSARLDLMDSGHLGGDGGHSYQTNTVSRTFSDSNGVYHFDRTWQVIDKRFGAF
jgi:hypothetical protein